MLESLERQQGAQYSLEKTSRDPKFLTNKPEFHI